MPFVKKNDSQGSQLPADARKIFIGRTSELLFFVQNILKPENPTHNIVSIFGQGGVGKSTLLARFRDEVHSAKFNSYCSVAIVDERQNTVANIMEKLAEQLHMKGEFKRALSHYRETLRGFSIEQEHRREMLLQTVPDIAGATVEGIPFAGPVLREGAKFTAAHLLNERRISQLRRDAEKLEDPIGDLTKAFVTELDRITDIRGIVSSNRQKRQRRVILLLDTFEQLAKEAVPWLLDYFLELPISSNVVLVIAGRDSLKHTTPNDPKRWLPYYDSGTIYSMPLNTFTEDETHAYLIERGITDSTYAATIWQLSQGLPLYLGLLTSNPRGSIDPTKDVVDNFLRWIPEHEHVKRKMAIHASLFSKPFNLDDFEAFEYLPEGERLALYHWLVKHPFVRLQEGRYVYHDLARELFSRYLYQHSKNEYYATRRFLAQFYQESLEKIPLEGGREAHYPAEWLELSLALVFQLLLLPDEGGYIKAIELILYAYDHAHSWEQKMEIARTLRELFKEQSNNSILESARQISLNLQQIIEINKELFNISARSRRLDRNQQLLTSVNYLLKKVVDAPQFPADFLASLYRKRGAAFYSLDDYEKALEDFERAIAIDSEDASVYAERGIAYRLRGANQLAIEEFNRAIDLNPESFFFYAQRGMTYNRLGENQRAIKDFDYALSLNNNRGAWIYINRGRAYKSLKLYQTAIDDFNRAIALDTQDWQKPCAYNARANIRRILGECQLALDDLETALESDPDYIDTYGTLGETYLWMKDIEQAKSSFARGWELDPAQLVYGWMVEWSNMCLEQPDPGMPGRLEAIAATFPKHFIAYICRGVAKWLRGESEESLLELEQAIKSSGRASFWKGMIYGSLGKEEEVIAAIEKFMELEQPPILLIPLRWLKHDKPEFYEKCIVPLLARYAL